MFTASTQSNDTEKKSKKSKFKKMSIQDQRESKENWAVVEHIYRQTA